MEKKVEQLGAMFQKAESDIENISQKLKYQFENDEEIKVNPVRMMDKLSDVKKEMSVLVKEAASLQEAQKETVNEFKGQIDNVYQLLQKLQSEEIIATGEKPEELKQLEELLGVTVPWGDNTGAPSLSGSSSHTLPSSLDSGQ